MLRLEVVQIAATRNAVIPNAADLNAAPRTVVIPIAVIPSVAPRGVAIRIGVLVGIRVVLILALIVDASQAPVLVRDVRSVGFHEEFRAVVRKPAPVAQRVARAQS